jgi:glutamine cyclotransferase
MAAFHINVFSEGCLEIRDQIFILTWVTPSTQNFEDNSEDDSL